MKLKALRIAGFRSFKAPQELDLTNVPPGLYLVSGENQVEPELGGNGAGKSSLFEALYWADFGKTSRGLKAGNVRSWTGKSCAVEAEYEEGTVLRTWNPNELLWNGTVVDQATLEQELRLSPETSLSTFFFSQTEPFFLDLSAPARMDIYAQVLALDFWDHKSDQAKALAREAEQAAQALACLTCPLWRCAPSPSGGRHQRGGAALARWRWPSAARATRAVFFFIVCRNSLSIS